MDWIQAVAIDLSATLRHEAEVRFEGQGCRPDDAAALTAGLVGEVLGRLPLRAAVEGLSIALPGFRAADGQTYHAACWAGTESTSWKRFDNASKRSCLSSSKTMRTPSPSRRRICRPSMPLITLVVLIENGVGGGIISAGRIHRGRLRGAGEIGHMCLGHEGCVNDRRRPGRFESFVGKEALLARCQIMVDATTTWRAWQVPSSRVNRPQGMLLGTGDAGLRTVWRSSCAFSNRRKSSSEGRSAPCTTT